MSREDSKIPCCKYSNEVVARQSTAEMENRQRPASRQQNVEMTLGLRSSEALCQAARGRRKDGCDWLVEHGWGYSWQELWRNFGRAILEL